jgi:hypothetical protein
MDTSSSFVSDSVVVNLKLSEIKGISEMQRILDNFFWCLSCLDMKNHLTRPHFRFARIENGTVTATNGVQINSFVFGCITIPDGFYQPLKVMKTHIIMRKVGSLGDIRYPDTSSLIFLSDTEKESMEVLDYEYKNPWPNLCVIAQSVKESPTTIGFNLDLIKPFIEKSYGLTHFDTVMGGSMLRLVDETRTFVIMGIGRR